MKNLAVVLGQFECLRDANRSRQKEWHENGDPGASYKGNEMAGEAGEVCNVIKKLERERMGSRGSRATLEDLADELGDVVICLDLIAEHYGIALWEAVAKKFNKTSAKNGLKTFIE